MADEGKSVEDQVHDMLDIDITEEVTVDDIEKASRELTVRVRDADISFVESGDPQSDIDEDYRRGRQTLHNLIETGNSVLDSAIKLVNEERSPRAIEVTTGLIDKIAGLTEKLMDFQTKAGKAAGADESTPPARPSGGTTNIANQTVINAGDADDLQAILGQLEVSEQGELIDVEP